MTPEHIIEDFQIFDDWEDKYSYIIDLGKSLAKYPESKKTEEYLVRGCQSQVWLYMNKKTNNKFEIYIDSDSSIVKGIGAIIVSIYNNKTQKEIENFDIKSFLTEINLLNIITPTRGNGLKSMIEKITSF